MLTLAVDSSLPLLSVAIVRGQALLAKLALEAKGSRNEKLLPAVDWLLSESGIDRSEIELFAVTRGPGSFTGVRIGLATMQGLALALGRPLCAMSTHEAIAHGEGTDHAAQPLPQLEQIAVYDDAGRGEFFVSVYERGSELIAPRLASLTERDDMLKTAALVIPVPDFLRHANVAAGCAHRAVAIAAAGQLDQYADITPVYVRLAEAEARLQQKKQ